MVVQHAAGTGVFTKDGKKVVAAMVLDLYAGLFRRIKVKDFINIPPEIDQMDVFAHCGYEVAFT